VTAPAAAAIAALILASGFFSLFKQALAAAGKPSLLKKADDAEKRAQAKRRGTVGRARENARAERFRRVLEAAERPERLLAAARFWMHALRVTAAVLAGMGATFLAARCALGHFAARFSAPPMWLLADPPLVFGELLAAYAAAAGLAAAGIVAAILATDFVAKSAARSAPESVAAALIAPARVFALPLLPFFHAARSLAGRVGRIFPPKADREGMTEDELRRALIEGEKSGIVESKESAMVEGVFYLGDRPLGVFMTHRSEVQWLDINAPAADICAKVLESGTQRCFPVADGALDAIIGATYREDVLLDIVSEGRGGGPKGLRAIMRKASFAPETMPALKAFESFRRGEADFLFVMDEYGGFAGMVSARALMEEIVGKLAAPAGGDGKATRKEDGSWVASGGLNIDDTAELLSLPGLAGSGDYHTLAGLVLSLAGELPCAGDSFRHRGHRFTVLEMDGKRIDKVGIEKEQGAAD